MMDKNWLVRGIIIIKFCVLISVVAASSVVVETDESSANKNTVSDIKISLVIADSHESNIRIPETISKREYSLHRNDVQIIIPGLEVADSSSSSDIIESIKSNVDSSDFDRNLSPVTIINKRETQSSRVNKAQFKSNQPEPEYKSLNIPSTFHALSPKLPILAPLLQPVLSPIVNSPVVNSPIVNSPIVNSPIVNSPIVNSPIVNSPESQPSTIEPTIHMNPSIQPSLLNGIKPSQQPTVTEYSLSPHSSQPSANPSYSSTLIPTIFPSYYPSNKPSSQSIKSSTFIPTVETISLSFEPTLESPVIESSNPTSKPTNPPTFIPSENPVDPKPVHPSIKPLSLPRIPAILPYVNSPISFPFLYPPSNPSENPTQQPTIEPTSIPTESFAPTVYGMTGSPTSLDTIAPSTDTPTLYPPGSIIFQDFGIQYNVKVPPTIVTIPASPVGSQVAISDLYIAVTSPRTFASDYPIVEVYERATNKSVQINPHLSGAESGYALSIAVWSNIVAVGAPGYSYGGHSVYVYKMEGIEYTRICSFEGPSSDSTFGVDVEVKGNVIAVGALSTASGGDVYMYAYNQSGAAIGKPYYLENLLVNPGPEGSEFGKSIYLGNNITIVGAHGYAYIYSRTGSGGWILLSSLLPTNISGSTFGQAVAIYNDTAIVSDPALSDLYFFKGTAEVGSWYLLNKISTQIPSFGYYLDIAVNTNLQTDVTLELIVGARFSQIYLFYYRNGEWSTSTDVSLICPESCPAQYAGDCLTSVALEPGLVFCDSPYTSQLYEYSYEMQYIPTSNPTEQPTSMPTTATPTILPSYKPTILPSMIPSKTPTIKPSFRPTLIPTAPTKSPTISPSKNPSFQPSLIPSNNPTVMPTLDPSMKPSRKPSHIPSFIPSLDPSAMPTEEPSIEPSEIPTIEPSEIPTIEPSLEPSGQPTEPTVEPSFIPSAEPSILPTFLPSVQPSTIPSYRPTVMPSYKPSIFPTIPPSFMPTNKTISVLERSESQILALYITLPLIVVVFGLIMVIFGCYMCYKRKENISAQEFELSGQYLGHSDGYISKIGGSLVFDTTKSFQEQDVDNVRRISWEDIRLSDVKTGKIIIGEGSFGKVFRAQLITNDMNIKEKSDTFNNIGCLEKQEEVAIKLLNKELKDPKYSLKVALKEASIIIKASQEVESNENLIQVKGVVEGRLPKVIADKLNLFENEDYCGIVMRYEGGGSLKKYLKSRNNLSLEVKLRILCGIARGLRNLHSKDIIHGDIKPENVLLSSHVPPIMRLADFGMSKQRKKMNHEIDGTTLILRLDDEKSINDGFKGTKLYSAPELLRSMNGKYLPTTRKTDMYSFGILMWEVLTQLSASESYGINTKDKFISEVCRGTRPSINALPNCTPVEIKQLIECCWNGDRTKRKTAIEALDILQSCYLELTSNFNKVILSHSGNNKKLVRYIDEYLKSFGVKMVNGSDGNNIGNTFVLDKQISNDSFKSSQSSISIDTSLDSQSKPCNANNRSNVMIVCLDSIYVKSRKCINEFNKNYHKEETFLLVLEDASIILNSASKLYASGPDEKESVAEDTDVSSQIVSPDLFTKISSIVSPSQENSNDESNCVLISDKISVSIWSDPNKDESNQLKDILYDCLHPLSKFLKSKFPDAIMDSLFPVISTRNDTSNVNQTPNLSDTSTLSDQSKSRRKLWLESSGRASSGISSSQHRVISLKSGSGSSESMI